MEKLREEQQGDKLCFFFTNTRPFDPFDTVPTQDVGKVFDFAYAMSFGSKGEHRSIRSGGRHFRKPGEIFRDAFQGKLAEFALCKALSQMGIECPEPNLETWSLGKWDSVDAEVGGKKICIKSAKPFAELLLLETEDWDDEGRYIPNIESGISTYDIFFLVRISPNLEAILKRSRLLYSFDADETELENLITNEEWKFDIPGFITHEDLLKAIKNRYILPQKSFLNGKTEMDAENYYIQSGDMHSLEEVRDFPFKK